ncbi:zinc finger domain-containing protein [Nonomuraea salmonea]|uniref:DNA-binding phage zinc finger domain-containing protein n=1 Tax=Nonomuraea salmonea TaxID=46181 RepID=A0ABV5P4T8_9ACTN
MDEFEIVDLLTTMAAFDKRKFGKTEVRAWELAVGDLPFEDCKQAVINHYCTSTDYLMPVHVRKGAQRIRDQRIDERKIQPPQTDDPQAYLVDVRAQRRAIADGRPLYPVRALPSGAPPERVLSLIRGGGDYAPEVKAALTVHCPYCGAWPGKRCVVAGTKRPLTHQVVHDARLDLVCPACWRARDDDDRPACDTCNPGEPDVLASDTVDPETLGRVRQQLGVRPDELEQAEGA